MVSPFFSVQANDADQICVLRLQSADGMNRLARASVLALTDELQDLTQQGKPLVIAGNSKFFSVGADLEEIAALDGVAAYEFSKIGHSLMLAIEQFPAPVFAALSGYCMGGGLDLALACHRRIGVPNAIFGHRGAVLGLITGWDGTQRLPRLIGKARALQMFVAAEKLYAEEALQTGLVDRIAEDPVAAAAECIRASLHD